MTTVVVVKKAGQIAIAADTLVTFGDTRLANRYEDNTKVFKIDTDGGPSYVGMAGTVAHFPVLRKAISSMPREILKLGSKDEVFDTFTKLHPYLKENFFLQTKEEDSDPDESRGIGSGRSFALGAMHALYGKAKTAREVAEAGIAAGCEFDRNSAAPADIFTMKMKEPK
jgi:ATP-dependent HslUV protease subunit HslV